MIHKKNPNLKVINNYSNTFLLAIFKTINAQMSFVLFIKKSWILVQLEICINYAMQIT